LDAVIYFALSMLGLYMYDKQMSIDCQYDDLGTFIFAWCIIPFLLCGFIGVLLCCFSSVIICGSILKKNIEIDELPSSSPNNKSRGSFATPVTTPKAELQIDDDNDNLEIDMTLLTVGALDADALESVDLNSIEQNVTSTRVKHLIQKSEVMDIQALEHEISKIHGTKSISFVTDEESDEPMDEAELCEIERRKSQSKSEPDFQRLKSNLVRQNTQTKWLQHDVDSMKKDLEKQKSFLQEQQEIAINNDLPNIPVVKANLFRNASAECWSPAAVKTAQKEIERELLKQLTEGKRLDANSLSEDDDVTPSPMPYKE